MVFWFVTIIIIFTWLKKKPSGSLDVVRTSSAVCTITGRFRHNTIKLVIAAS